MQVYFLPPYKCVGLRIALNCLSQDYDAVDLQEFEETILRGCDYDQDGKISKKELTMILLALSKTSLEEEAS
jgi:calretinin